MGFISLSHALITKGQLPMGAHSVIIKYTTTIAIGTVSKIPHWLSLLLLMLLLEEPPIREVIGRFLLSKSKDHRPDFDDAYGQRTPGTGVWFLESEVYQAWKKGEFRNLSCVGIREL